MISYRRADTGAIAGRIFDRLAAHYGRESIFRDVDSIPLSVDFREHLAQTLRESDIVLVIIGSHWLGRGRELRVAQANDPVRVEVETALASGVTIIPIFIDDAMMPDPTRLPESMRNFTYRNGQRVDSGQDFDHHMARLLRNMDALLRKPEPKASAPASKAVINPEAIEKGKLIARRMFSMARQAVDGVTITRKPVAPRSERELGEPLRLFRWHSGLILSIMFSPDGNTLASASLDRTTKLWDVASGQMRLSLTREPRCAALAVCYSPDGETLAVGGEDGSTTLFETRSGKIVRTLTGFPGVGHWLSFSGNGRMLRAGAARVVRVWDLDHETASDATGRHVDAALPPRPLPQNAETASFATIGRIANRLLEKANDIKLRALYWTSGQSVAASPDDRHTAVASEFKITLRESDSAQPARSIAGTWGLGTRLAFSPDGKILAVGTLGQPVRLWDVESGSAIAILGPASNGAWALAFSPIGQLLAVACGEGTIKLWDISQLNQAGAPAPSGAGLP